MEELSIEETVKIIIQKIEESENINQLPLYNDFFKLVNEDSLTLDEALEDTDIFNENFIMKIKDGTKVIFERCANSCFSNKNHWYLYNIIDEDIYICMECGLWQKPYNDLKEEVGYSDFGDEVLLPFDWDEKGIKSYLRRKANRQEEHEVRKEREELFYSDCCCCIHMKHDECEYGNDEEECGDFERR